MIHHSQFLDGNVTTHKGIRVTTPERTIIDLSPALDDPARRKVPREALRIRRVTIASLDAALIRHPTRRGTAALRHVTVFYSLLQLARCDSDAEAYAMELLAKARRPLPMVNRKIDGHRADLTWDAQKLIIEIDGPQFHRDKLLDAHKTAVWTSAGYKVRRIESDDIFGRPGRLLDLVPDR